MKDKVGFDGGEDEVWPNINIIDVAQHWLIADPTVCFVTITQVGCLQKLQTITYFTYIVIKIHRSTDAAG